MLFKLLNPAVLVFLIPLAAICGHFILRSQKMRYEHDERIAKIEAGIDPDDDIETV